MKGLFEKRMAFLYTKDKEKVTFKDLSVIPNMIDEAQREFPQFRDFTHEPPDDLTAEEFLNASILEFADFHGYITAIKEYKEKWFGEQ